MRSAVDDARQLIASRVAELDAEAKQLERAIASMGESRSQGTQVPLRVARASTTAGTAPRKRKAGRAPRGQRREQLLAAVKANPGARPVDLAKKIGVKPAQVHALLAKARAEKLVVKSGVGYALKG